jgi:diguanylate cyclase (GGDEF)-like protein
VDSDRILDALRPLVLVVDATGTILDARGGFGGFFGWHPTELAGSSVFRFVAPHQAGELTSFFVESAEQLAEVLSLPLPFRVAFLGADGSEHSVDVIHTGGRDHDGEVHWVVALVPVELQASVSRSIEAEMAGEPRARVKELLTEELLVENLRYSSRWFLVDLNSPSGVTVTTARGDDRTMARALEVEIRHCGWRPWAGVTAALAPLTRDELPDGPKAIAVQRRWRRVSVAPVHLDGALVAAYLLFGKVPDGYDVSEVDSNVVSRVRRLVEATALLIARWQDQDRLVTAATRDPLTGLANRDAFADALADCAAEAILLYIDVDRFKAVNDRHGHGVGDRVLVEVARRIVAACRPNDVVARFGGDEFVVLLNAVDVQHGTRIGQRIVHSVAAPLADSDGLEGVTVSIGLAPVVRGDDAVQAADVAMLEAKRAGRARLIASEER